MIILFIKLKYERISAFFSFEVFLSRSPYFAIATSNGLHSSSLKNSSLLSEISVIDLVNAGLPERAHSRGDSLNLIRFLTSSKNVFPFVYLQ